MLELIVTAAASIGLICFGLLVIKVWMREPEGIPHRLQPGSGYRFSAISQGDAWETWTDSAGPYPKRTLEDWRDAVPDRLWERWERRERIIRRLVYG